MSYEESRHHFDQLSTLVHHRWNILVIAALYQLRGAKYVTLLNTLKVSRASLSASLKHLAQLELVARNPGYGHPMRPEYLLTDKGMMIGKGCQSLVKTLHAKKEVDLAFRKWTLPLVAAIGEHNRGFSQLRSSLGDPSPRAITIGLKGLLHQRWVKRTIVDEFPPTAGYELRPKGQVILVRLSSLQGF